MLHLSTFLSAIRYDRCDHEKNVALIYLFIGDQVRVLTIYESFIYQQGRGSLVKRRGSPVFLSEGYLYVLNYDLYLKVNSNSYDG